VRRITYPFEGFTEISRLKITSRYSFEGSEPTVRTSIHPPLPISFKTFSARSSDPERVKLLVSPLGSVVVTVNVDICGEPGGLLSSTHPLTSLEYSKLGVDIIRPQSSRCSRRIADLRKLLCPENLSVV